MKNSKFQVLKIKQFFYITKFVLMETIETELQNENPKYNDVNNYFLICGKFLDFHDLDKKFSLTFPSIENSFWMGFIKINFPFEFCSVEKLWRLNLKWTKFYRSLVVRLFETFSLYALVTLELLPWLQLLYNYSCQLLSTSFVFDVETFDFNFFAVNELLVLCLL